MSNTSSPSEVHWGCQPTGASDNTVTCLRKQNMCASLWYKQGKQAKPLPSHLPQARHAGEWRSSDSEEKGSYWKRIAQPRPNPGFGIGAFIAPPSPHGLPKVVRTKIQTAWMPVNGLSHEMSLEVLDSDVDDHKPYILRYDDPPCTLPCLHHILQELPKGRFGICPVHERLIPHPLPPPAIGLSKPNAEIKCKPLNAISSIFFHVQRFEDQKALEQLEKVIKALEKKIIKHIVHYPVQGGHAVCRYQKALHRCRINTIGMEVIQVDLIDQGTSAIIKHDELFTMPTDVAMVCPALSFRCSLMEQDTRLLDFKSTSSFHDLIMKRSYIVLEVHGDVTSDGKHLVRLIDPPPPEKPKDPFVGRGTHNRKPKFRLQDMKKMETAEDENKTEDEHMDTVLQGFRNSDDEDDDFDYNQFDYNSKTQENLFF
ncbi:unnamed protein product [Bursaphelenchus okinawaensis]|uniref:Tudor domain-containing protein n=1 Tax=Bursaphelenchus okinawaensis TaxID=465554 RepID=A0A811JQ93_9BILA|nr:unnamed protein product [Bursaphelenchus okinawaensis]CAG9077904.1 unnamed protein product [Bursaphelenchus okinawaensis]